MQNVLTPLTFSGDMSTDLASNVFDFGQYRRACIQISNPATGTPVGAYALLVGNDRANLAPYFDPDTNPISPQPTGTAYNHIIDHIETDALYGQVTYTRESGGTGATPTVLITLRE